MSVALQQLTRTGMHDGKLAIGVRTLISLLQCFCIFSTRSTVHMLACSWGWAIALQASKLAASAILAGALAASRKVYYGIIRQFIYVKSCCSHADVQVCWSEHRLDATTCAECSAIPCRDIVPLGQVKSRFNYNVDLKRVLNFENVVDDSDNVKQDMSIDVYGRKDKDEEPKQKAAAPAAQASFKISFVESALLSIRSLPSFYRNSCQACLTDLPSLL